MRSDNSPGSARALRVVFGASPYEEMARCYSIAYASVAVLKDIEVARKMRLSKVFPALSCGVPVVFAGAGETPELLVQHAARRLYLRVPDR